MHVTRADLLFHVSTVKAFSSWLVNFERKILFSLIFFTVVIFVLLLTVSLTFSFYYIPIMTVVSRALGANNPFH